MILESHSGLDLQLSRRVNSTPRVNEFVRKRRRFKLSLLAKMTFEVEEQLKTADVVCFFVLCRKIHAAPRIDSRGLRYIAWQITDMYDAFAQVLFYGSACTLMASQTTGVLWVAANPRLLPANAKEDSVDTGNSNTRRTFVIMSEDDLMPVGKLAGYSFCLAKDRRGVPCGNPVDTCRSGVQLVSKSEAFCSFHQKLKQKEDDVFQSHINSGSILPDSNKNSRRSDLKPEVDGEAVSKTSAKTENEKVEIAANDSKAVLEAACGEEKVPDKKLSKGEEQGFVAVERRRRRHMNRDVNPQDAARAWLVHGESKNDSQDATGKKGISLREMAEVENNKDVGKICQFLTENLAKQQSIGVSEKGDVKDVEDVTRCVRSLAAANLDADGVGNAERLLGGSLQKAKQVSDCEELAAAIFVLERQWRRTRMQSCR